LNLNSKLGINQEDNNTGIDELNNEDFQGATKQF